MWESDRIRPEKIRDNKIAYALGITQEDLMK